MKDDEQNPPQVTATFFDSEIKEVRPGELGPETASILKVELSNGRTLLIDDWGVIEAHDIDPALPTSEQRFFYLSWDELLKALDEQRQAGLN